MVIVTAILVAGCDAVAAQSTYPAESPAAAMVRENNISSIAPAWPFRGFFDPAAGRFWDTHAQRVHDVSGSLSLGDCLEDYVRMDEFAVWIGYRSYVDPLRERHFVIPWGDIVFPVIGSGYASLGGKSSLRSVSDAVWRSQQAIDAQIHIRPARATFDASEQEGGDIGYVAGFEAANASESYWYRPVGSVRGVVKHWPRGRLIIEELVTLIREEGANWYVDDVYFTGTDGRYYGLTIYDMAHPMCQDTARTLLIDGESGAVVGCHVAQLERVTPLVFVAPDETEWLGVFELPDAPSPIGIDNCPVRIDRDLLGFFRATLGDSPHSLSERR